MGVKALGLAFRRATRTAGAALSGRGERETPKVYNSTL